MATINVRCFFDQNRFQLESIDLNSMVNEFINRISENVTLSDKEIELVYCGNCLQRTKTLESYGVKNGSMVYAVKKNVKEPVDSGKPNETEIAKVLTAFRMAIFNPSYRTTVENMLMDSDAVENLILTTPGLANDMTVLIMFQDLKLLLQLHKTKQIRQIIDEHPAFYHVAQLIAATVNEQGAKAGESFLSSAAYSLDQMSDDEESASPLHTQEQSPLQLDGSSIQGITASQLAAALAAASVPAGFSDPSTSGARMSDAASTSDSIGASPPISSDFFQQAMVHAQYVATQTQLQQLRDMGITDEGLALHALQEAGGDIQAALEYIFGDIGGGSL
ncbi:7 [Octopus vulgaris]|uniref:7 n=2 Tax=Octopus TaxID=6643 RepID=A0AA36BHA4_OCTVU|nr:ubiquitin-like protein 7 isoform X1 [Octopus sinensis]CAI9734054.1 7 [Octopus vulgaris] [Octopus vulgaris]